MIIRQFERNRIYKLAKKRADELNKPLIVIGDPFFGNGSKFMNKFIKGYDCGDETVDLTGAPLCTNGIKSDLIKYLIKKPDNSGVIFISCVLEYIPTEDLELVIKNLKRVAGGIENVFVVTVSPYTIAGYFYKDLHSSSKHIVYAPPNYKNITYKIL
jgi:hypothetical protein